VGWPTHAYDRSQNRLIANVFVNDRWWSQADTKTAKDELQSNGSLYCVRPFFVDPQLEHLVPSKRTGCEVNFYNHKAGRRRVVVATFFADRDELVLR
jgi:hypothetical protein